MSFTPKVQAALVAGAFTSILVSELGRRGIEIKGDEASAITTVLSCIAGYFAPRSPRQQDPQS